MHIADLKSTLVELAPRKSPVLSVSAPGVGKTAAHKQVAQFLTHRGGYRKDPATGFDVPVHPWHYFSLVLTNFDPWDVVGFNVPQRYTDGRLGAELTEPFWWREVFDCDGTNKSCILHLDEVTDCETPAQKVAAQIVFDRRVGTRRLPDGVWVLLSGNRRKDKSGVQRLATMFQNRVIEVEVSYHTDTHLQYMQHVGFHPVGLSFIHQEFPSCYEDNVPDEPGPFLSPRSFEEGVRDLEQIGRARGMPSHMLPSDPAAQAIMTGRIGAGAAAQFFTHVKYADQLPSLDEIALNPAKAKMPDSMGGQYITAFMLGAQTQDQHLAPVMKYFDRMKVEMQAVAAKALVDRNRLKGELKGLFAAKGFTDWCRDHSDVILLTV